MTGDGVAGIDAGALDVEALHRQHWPGLWRLAMALTADTAAAEDLAQEAFARLLRASGRRSSPAPGMELAYLRRSVVNLSNSRFRRLAVARRHAPALHVRVDAGDADHDAADGRARQEAVRAAIAALPGRQRACVVLHYYEGLADTGVAEVLGISPGSVKAHLHRARATLAARLEDQR